MRFPSESLGSGGVSSAVVPLEGIRNRREGGWRAPSLVYAYSRDEGEWTKGVKGYPMVSVFRLSFTAVSVTLCPMMDSQHQFVSTTLSTTPRVSQSSARPKVMSKSICFRP